MIKIEQIDAIQDVEIREGVGQRSIKVYTITKCSHCVSAKELFDSKGVFYENINVEDPLEFDKIFSVTGQKTVPQIFIGEEFIGGFDKLTELNTLGMLDLKLGRLFNLN